MAASVSVSVGAGGSGVGTEVGVGVGCRGVGVAVGVGMGGSGVGMAVGVGMGGGGVGMAVGAALGVGAGADVAADEDVGDGSGPQTARANETTINRRNVRLARFTPPLWKVWHPTDNPAPEPQSRLGAPPDPPARGTETGARLCAPTHASLRALTGRAREPYTGITPLCESSSGSLFTPHDTRGT